MPFAKYTDTVMVATHCQLRCVTNNLDIKFRLAPLSTSALNYNDPVLQDSNNKDTVSVMPLGGIKALNVCLTN